MRTGALVALTASIVMLSSTYFGAAFAVSGTPSLPGYAGKLDAAPDNQHVKFLEQSTFIDSAGRMNVMGTVRNTGSVPLKVQVGVNVTDGSAMSHVLNGTYGHIIWPSTDSPFKLTLTSSQKPIGEAFIADVSPIDLPNIGVLTLNYTNMAVGDSRSLTGTVRNDGQFPVYDVRVFASVHDVNMTQLDSVESNVIPELKPGQIATFVASPDPAIRSKVLYYSCAGLDLRDPITTLDLGEGKFLAFDLRALAKVSSLKYDNSSNSIVFDIVHYNPDGGPIGIKIPQSSKDQRVQVMMDGAPYGSNATSSDGSTISINLFIPKGQHHVQIENVSVVPEYPVVPLALAGSIVVAIIIARLKTDFIRRQ